MSIVDAPQAIRSHLLSYSDLTDLVGDRISQGSAPQKGWTPSDGPCVTYRLVGGRVDGNDAVLLPMVVVDSWASTPQGAHAVYLQVFAALDDQSSAHIQHSAIETIGEDLIDPDTHWPFTSATFRAWVAKE